MLGSGQKKLFKHDIAGVSKPYRYARKLQYLFVRKQFLLVSKPYRYARKRNFLKN